MKQIAENFSEGNNAPHVEMLYIVLHGWGISIGSWG